ncbi:META domain-containing protein [Chryseobacterium oryzae]|uniref:META domain-containing protein n=1 Tax=Chryseobacterium oryzae TaxID=2929799 RepID=A0ABY4BDD6_9FLAO|nr:META domain-containing protein [Chryseobacterium oryzae]UOE37177.1 META domain-containing protein [Chryseobacterium oryzae]
MKNIFLSICTFALLASCGTTKNASAAKVGKEQPSIVNTKWALADNVKGQIPTLQIEGSKINGNSGCNRFFGGVVMDTTSGKFETSGVGSTRMACNNMSVEKNFLDMLQKANKYVVSGDTLELYQDNLLLLKFNKSE